MEEPSTPITFFIPSALEASTTGPGSHHVCLESLIARGDTVRTPYQGDAQLLALFGGDPSGVTARAAVSHYAQYESSDAEQWRIIASPVHLVADHATLHFPKQNHSLMSDEESRALMASCQDHFAEEGWQLEYGDANTWYLWVHGSSNITTTPLEGAIGNPLFEILPQGNDARLWRRWINEAQMLFHTHAVNDARHKRGEPSINSLWFWGEGRLPQLAQGRFRHVYGGGRYVQGLAQLSGTQWSPLPEGIAAMNEPDLDGPLLIVLNESDKSSWDSAWFCAVGNRLRVKHLSNVAFHFCNNYATQLKHSMLWRFWRRKNFSIATVESAS